MSFAELELPELKAVIASFVGEDDAATVNSVPEAVKLLEDEGVQYAEYQKWQQIEEAREDADEHVEPTTKQKKNAVKVTTAAKKKGNTPDEVVVKMTRPNMTYEVRGHRFTREHPFVVMTEDQAQEIFDLDGSGFRLATPREVQEYYK